ncbi:MAG: phosphodiesterase [candidate division Zixibacteria bacterium]|nr:phosphodiesterase [candidate division Zixibacteria bacterium]
MTRLVQLSDLHIVAPDKQPVHGNDTISHLERTVAAVNRLDPAPGFVLVTGDLTNDEQPASYTRVKSLLEKLHAPVHLALGNHDERKTFRSVVLDEAHPSADRYCYTFRQGEWRFVVLDSLDEGKVTGHIDEDQLRWLADTLDADASTPTVVCLHHPPVPIDVAWLDALMLIEPERLLSVFDARPCVRLVLCGHVHQPSVTHRGTYAVFTSPAVSFQFRREPLPPPAEKPNAIMSPDPPAFRVVDLVGDTWQTRLVSLL